MRTEARARRDAFFGAIGKAPLVMGILNLTPDLFSDGGRFQLPDRALAHARRMVEEGCAIIDVGAESTRPEATPVTQEQEIAQLAPVLEHLINGVDIPVSIDTTKAIVAALACRLGAVLINDVWGLQKDPAMAEAAAEAEAGVVITHNRAEKDESVDIIADIRRFFDRSLEIAARAGVPPARIILDPGVGFAKTARQNSTGRGGRRQISRLWTAGDDRRLAQAFSRLAHRRRRGGKSHRFDRCQSGGRRGGRRDIPRA